MSVSANVNIAAIGDDSKACAFLDRTKEKKPHRWRDKGDENCPVRPRGSMSARCREATSRKCFWRDCCKPRPKLIILDEPTRGVDIGAKSEIYRIIETFAHNGTGVLVIRSDLPELVGITDRVVVMRDGRIEGEVGGSTGTPITSKNHRHRNRHRGTRRPPLREARP